MRRYSKVALLAVSILLALSMALASEYPFGSKVLAGDTDFGKPLHPYTPPNPLPAGNFQIGYWETGQVWGYDDTDVVYLHQGALVTGILSNDVRLTPFWNLPAGSKVTPQDNDINKPLIALPLIPGWAAPCIAWANLYGGPTYDLDDPVYIHTTGMQPAGTPTLTSINDVRLTTIGQIEAGTKVHNFDPDFPVALSITGPPFNPIKAPLAAAGFPFWRIQYIDVNGNLQYDYPDDVYLCFPPFAWDVVRVNDVRLSGPVQW